MSIRRLTLVSLLTFAAVASTGSAQSTDAAALRPPARQALSVNPLYLPFGGIVLEYEAATAPGLTLGVGGSYYDPVGGDDESYGTLEAKLRFYPGERALRGFSVGITFGVGRTDEGDVCCDFNGNPLSRVTHTGATSGVVLDYNWLIGPTRRFFVGTGIGAKRFYGDLGNNQFFDIEVVPTARIQLGAAF